MQTLLEVRVLPRSLHDPNPEAFHVVEVLKKGVRGSLNVDKPHYNI
jgi:hypothetical protein